jgi:hypothetical protein
VSVIIEKCFKFLIIICLNENLNVFIEFKEFVNLNFIFDTNFHSNESFDEFVEHF